MKKFKSRRKINYYRIISYIVAATIFIIFFIWVSFQKLEDSHSDFIKLVMNYSGEKKNYLFDLDNLISLPIFIDNKTTIKNKQVYFHEDSSPKILSLLKSNLRKLGIEIINSNRNNSREDLFYIKEGNIQDIVDVDGKKYAKILLTVDNDSKVLKKIKNYFDDNYSKVLQNIVNKNNEFDKNIILIEVGSNNGIDAINNSTEIISLMIYNLVGD